MRIDSQQNTTSVVIESRVVCKIGELNENSLIESTVAANQFFFQHLPEFQYKL